MKREAKLLLGKAIDSLILSVEIFNRPWDSARPEAVLILLDHSFELLLKACLIQRGGSIRKRGVTHTIGFDECLRVALTGKARFLVDDQVVLLRSINTLRDAAQHYLLDISEQHLYIQAQAGLILFDKLLRDAFGQDLRVRLPDRVLPLSTQPPTDLLSLFAREVDEVRDLLQRGRRRTVDAMAKLRGLAIVEGAARGESEQPSDEHLTLIGAQVRAGSAWDQVFPGVAALDLQATGYGPSIDLRITKNQGLPVHLVPEGTPGAATVAVKRVDERGFYSLSHGQLVERLGITGPRLTALIRYLELEADPECHSVIVMGKSSFKRYSPKALKRLTEALAQGNMDEVWKTHRPKPKRQSPMSGVRELAAMVN